MGSCSNFGSDASRLGRYQLCLPGSFIVAGGAENQAIDWQFRVGDGSRSDWSTRWRATIAGFTALTEAHGDEQAATLVADFCDAVRVGLHHGPAIERDADYFGAAVNLAARVAAAATGGEVLLTAHTAALAPDLDDVLYESRGRQTLRNVRDTVELVAVRQGHTSDHGLAIDPVCRMAVDPDHAAGRLVVDDTAYFFCTLACAGAFAHRPERFVS